jgi:AcrR family transcriptional regulator
MKSVDFRRHRMGDGQVNRKVRYTRMVLRESLLELMETYNVASISVKELCGKADINRATFYANYKNIGELLHSIEEEIKAELTVIFERGLA